MDKDSTQNEHARLKSRVGQNVHIAPQKTAKTKKEADKN